MKLKTFIPIILISILASCGIPQGEKIVRKHKRLKAMSDAKIYTEVVNNYLEYKTLNLKKITISYNEGNKKQSFRGSLRVLKDSIIWLSISKMGIEGMRIKLTPDSVAFIDRLHREYLITDYEYLNKKFKVDLDFFLIQSILTNRLPEYRMSGELPFFRNFKGKKTKRHYIFYTKKRRDKKYWKEQGNISGNIGSTWETLRISPDLMRVESIDIYDMQVFPDKSKQDVSFQLNYEEYKNYNEKYLFPEKIWVKLRQKIWKDFGEEQKQKKKVFFTITVDKLEINDEDLSFPFRISSKYKQIDE